MFSTSGLLCSVFLFCSCRVGYYATDTLGSGDWIDEGGRTLVSTGGRFELGFFNASGGPSQNRFIGIRYKQDPQTIVWVANRNSPVTSNSTGTFSLVEGNLKVSDASGKEYWTTSLESSSTNRSAKLMDSGNLVLCDDDQFARCLWESFKCPTDTFLPGMKMEENLSLTSWIRDDDPGKGRFSFHLRQGENRFFISEKPVFAERRKTPGNLYGITQMRSGVANLLLNSTKSVKPEPFVTAGGKQLTKSPYNSQRLIMNYTGQVEYLVQVNNNSQWQLLWRAPEDKCKNYNSCGDFGSCNVNNPVQCKCLPGFKPIDPESWNSGNYIGGCTRNSMCSQNDTFLSLKMMKATNPALEVEENNETQCRKYCLKTCVCVAYSYGEAEESKLGDSCRIWTSTVSNLQEYVNGGINLYVRVAKSDIESTARNCEPCGTNMIPYPLSTGPNCGDPAYFNFHCDNSTGQVKFETPSGIYRVAGIDLSTRTFVIEVQNSVFDRSSRGKLRLSQPFLLNMSWTSDSRNTSSNVQYAKISWKPPEEPDCTSSEDCKDWPSSTCNVSTHGKGRCVCTAGFQWDGSKLNCTKEGEAPQLLEEPSNRNMSLVVIIVIPLVIMFVLACIIVCIYMWRRKMTKRRESSDRRNQALRTLDSERRLKDLLDSGEFKEDEQGVDVPFFDFESILAATDNFSDANKLGQGGYGPVYKGKFPGGQEIAVKRLSIVSGQGLQEFRNEVVLIAKLQHKNLVKLRGCCTRGDEKILLYEYMPNKSLDSFIFDQKPSKFLDWEMRVNIILGIARGLLYLHHDSRLKIIHRDLKTSNILLDEEMNPKISDFGLARMIESKEIGAKTTRVVGTYGYMSPEYAMDGLFSIKSDVFSFGVVLLEIISGKKNTGFYQSELALSLVGYAWRLWTENKVLDLVDPALHEVCNSDQFVKFVNVGLLCVQEDPNGRPTISNVVTMLDSEAATVPTPKQPAFVPRGGPSGIASSSSRLSTHSEETSTWGET